MGLDSKRPLKDVAEAFSDLAQDLHRGGGDVGLDLACFANACDRVSVLFGCLGVAFKFAERDYVAKVKDLVEAAKDFQTLPAMIDGDMRTDTVRQPGSHTRNLLRVKRGVDMLRILFQQSLLTEGNSLKDPATLAYDETFAPYHSWAIRTAVAAGMHILPSKSNFLAKLNEKEESALEHVQSFKASAEVVVYYVNDLFTSNGLGLDW